MVTALIKISDADLSRDYVLSVDYDILAGEPRSWSSPASAPAVEVNAVRCVEIMAWCGKTAASALPDQDHAGSTEKHIGEWCWEKYPQEIEAAICGYEHLHAEAY